MTETADTIMGREAPPMAENYRYRDANLDIIWHTSVPKDDEAAIAYFHTLMRMSENFEPAYVEKRVPNSDGPGEKYVALKVKFDPETYTTTDRR